MEITGAPEMPGLLGGEAGTGSGDRASASVPTWVVGTR